MKIILCNGEGLAELLDVTSLVISLSQSQCGSRAFTPEGVPCAAGPKNFRNLRFQSRHLKQATQHIGCLFERHRDFRASGVGFLMGRSPWQLRPVVTYVQKDDVSSAVSPENARKSAARGIKAAGNAVQKASSARGRDRDPLNREFFAS